MLNGCRASVQSDGNLWKQVVVSVIAQLHECISCQGSISLNGTFYAVYPQKVKQTQQNEQRSPELVRGFITSKFCLDRLLKEPRLQNLVTESPQGWLLQAKVYIIRLYKVYTHFFPDSICSLTTSYMYIVNSV